MGKTPLAQVYEWIDESERRIWRLELKLRRREILKNLLFFIPLSPEFLGGETYRQLKAEERQLAWLKTLTQQDTIRCHAWDEFKARRAKAIAKATIEAYERIERIYER